MPANRRAVTNAAELCSSKMDREMHVAWARFNSGPVLEIILKRRSEEAIYVPLGTCPNSIFPLKLGTKPIQVFV